jgi:hypothetical protein
LPKSSDRELEIEMEFQLASTPVIESVADTILVLCGGGKAEQLKASTASSIDASEQLLR